MRQESSAGAEPGHEVDACITVLIAVAVRLYCDGLAKALAAHAGLRIQATTGAAAEIEALALALQPDVVIVDVAQADVFSLIGTLRARCARSRILAFAVREEIELIIDYATAGADGFFSANGSLAELVETIERLAAGEVLCSPRVAAELLRRAARRSPLPSPQGTDDALTRREDQVFVLLRQGRSNKQIGIALNISEATVKNHVHHLLQKLHVATRGQAAARGGMWSPSSSVGASDARLR